MADPYYPKDMGAIVAQARALSSIGHCDPRDWSVEFPKRLTGNFATRNPEEGVHYLLSQTN